MNNSRLKSRQENVKSVPTKEMIIYMISIFMFSNFNGMSNYFRQDYLVNVLSFSKDDISLINVILRLVEFLMPLAYALIIDRAPKPGKDKIRPLVMFSIIPIAISSVFLYYIPNMQKTASIIFFLSVMALFNLAFTFGDMVNRLPVAMTDNLSERDSILSIRSIVSAVANSAPLVVVLVLDIIKKGMGFSQETLYIISALLSGACCCISLMFGMRAVKERIPYSSEKVNPWKGFGDVVRNKYAWILIASDFLKEFRAIASYMGIFLSAALLGQNKFVLFGLPTGIGTMVGMLLVKQLLKKFNSKQIYMTSGVYSLIINCITFAVGVQAFKNPDDALWQILFIFFLFTIGLQFGASNLLPDMFKSDVLEDLEVKTHKRLEGSLYKIVGLGGALSKLIADAVAPQILIGDGSFIGYIQAVDGVYPEQSYEVKVRLLLVYTILHGIMMLSAGIPFFLYNLTGKVKEDVHDQALEYRASLMSAKEGGEKAPEPVMTVSDKE